MPTTSVTTWQQFLDAYAMPQGTKSDPHTIEIMADLNGNDAPMRAGLDSSNYYKVINGNFHNINNINTGAVVSARLFSGLYVTWNKCNFTNMYRNESYPFFGGVYQSYTQYFIDCTFQGKGYGIAGSGTFSRCVITWESSRTTSGIFLGSYFAYCYIDANYKRDATTNFDYSSLVNCYVKGKIEPATSDVTNSYYLVGSSAMRNSCINIETTLNYPNGLHSGDPQLSINVYNTSKMTGTIQKKSDTIGVTDAQMKDAAYLASVGFNIIE